MSGKRKTDQYEDEDLVQKSNKSTPVLPDKEVEQIAHPLRQYLYLTPNLFLPIWPKIREKLHRLINHQNLTPFELQQHIEDIYCLHFQAQTVKSKINFCNLLAAINEFDQKKELLARSIQKFAKIALSLESEFRDYLPMLLEEVELSHEKCAVLIANMFFCTTHLQPDSRHLPQTFNMAKLFNNFNSDNQLKIQKIKCFLHYIMYVTQQGPAPGMVVFARRKGQFNFDSIPKSPLCEFVYCEKGCMENVDDAFIVDFANQKLGGGVLTAGCVQEEILFLAHPEMLVSMLFTTTLQNDEAVIAQGVERIINYSGYKNSFKCLGLYSQAGIRKFANFICIDAQDYSTRTHYQYGDYKQEVLKSFIGFQKAKRVCTGRWGCGVFGAEWQLKCLIQWFSASCAGCQELIFVNDQKYELNQAFAQLASYNTVQLFQLIEEYCQLKQNDQVVVDAIDYILIRKQ